MEDKKLDEIKEYVKNLDSNISLSRTKWKLKYLQKNQFGIVGI